MCNVTWANKIVSSGFHRFFVDYGGPSEREDWIWFCSCIWLLLLATQIWFIWNIGWVGLINVRGGFDCWNLDLPGLCTVYPPRAKHQSLRRYLGWGLMSTYISQPNFSKLLYFFQALFVRDIRVTFKAFSIQIKVIKVVVLFSVCNFLFEGV